MTNQVETHDLLRSMRDAGVKAGDSIIFAIDVSGAVTRGVLSALAEAAKVNRLMAVTVFQFDTQVVFTKTFFFGEFENMVEMPLTGRGGSFVQPVISAAETYGGPLFIYSDCLFGDADWRSVVKSYYGKVAVLTPSSGFLLTHLIQ